MEIYLLALKLTQRRVFTSFFPLRCLLPPVRCTFCFISNAVCSLGVKAYQFSRTSNSRNLRLCRVDKFIRTKKFAKPRRLNLGSEKISRKAALITVHLKNVRTLLMSKLPLHMENAKKRSSYSGCLQEKPVLTAMVSKTLSRRYLNSTESPVPVVTQKGSTEWWKSGKVTWLKVS